MIVNIKYDCQLYKYLFSGNDHLHQLTSLGTSDFYVRLEKFTGGWAYAKYNNFTVADESDGYRMRLKVGSYQGNAGYLQTIIYLVRYLNTKKIGKTFNKCFYYIINIIIIGKIKKIV